MTKNNKPVLSILIDKDKRDRFAEFSRRNNLSMGYLVNQAIDRMLETDSIDTSPIIYRQSVATTPLVDSQTIAMSRSDVENLIKTYVDSLGGSINSVGSTDSNSSVGISIEDVERMINNGVEPLAERLNGIETYTHSQFAAVRDELKALSDCSVTTESIAVPIATKIAHNQTKTEGEPEWVNKDNRRFYLKLVGNSELIAKATEEIERHPNDNKSLAESLVKVGIHKQDGTAFDSASTSRIKGVVKNLNTPEPI
jgi:hypothetical protein